MFHGGTNFGFFNGANYYDSYKVTSTSYDYCALLTEDGDITPAYLKVRKTIEKHFGKIPYDIPQNKIKKAYGKVPFTAQAKLFDNLEHLSSVKQSAVPMNMESYGQNYGYILYRTHIKGPRETLPLRILDIHDRAQILLDGKTLGVYQRDEEQTLDITIPKEGALLEVLVENMGCINYSVHLQDYKGITKGITLGDRFLFGYDVYNLKMNDLSQLAYTKENLTGQGPSFYQAHLTIDEPHDTFIKFSNLTKGFMVVNGFNIGRYWNIGPQETLFVPEALLKSGKK